MGFSGQVVVRNARGETEKPHDEPAFRRLPEYPEDLIDIVYAQAALFRREKQPSPLTLAESKFKAKTSG
jgi:hypothetical protein